MSHLYLNTCLRNGLSLNPHEYGVVKSLLGKSDESLIVMSEFAGFSGISFRSINPYNVTEIEETLNKAIRTSKKERVEYG